MIENRPGDALDGALESDRMEAPHAILKSSFEEEAEGGVPGAAAKGAGALGRHSDPAGGLLDYTAFGKLIEELALAVGGPAVVAGAGEVDGLEMLEPSVLDDRVVRLRPVRRVRFRRGFHLHQGICRCRTF